MPKLIYSAPIFTHQIDFAGHVNNGVYLRWLEEARQLLLEGAGFSIPRLLEQGIVPILADLTIEYKAPLYLHNTMRLEMGCQEIRFASVTIVGDFYNEANRLIATSSQTALFIDRQSHKPLRMTPEQRSQFSIYQI
ncbi:MAG: acyl-CoA thioesterase [Cyanobacteria bacterium M5B4]|nr:MAG: acyl-CoA thioesterase [Cyanobacteria bacterium M5B4]